MLDEKRRRVQEAMASKPTTPVHNLETLAMNAMGSMDEVYVIFGPGAEISLDIKVYIILTSSGQLSNLYFVTYGR